MWENDINNTHEQNNFNSDIQNDDSGSYSDIKYTYGPDASYTADTNVKKKKGGNGNGCFIAIIAVLLCITVAAAAISLVTAFRNKNNDNSLSPTSTPSTKDEYINESGNSSAIENYVQIAPTPTPQIVEGQLLTAEQAAAKVIPSVVCIQCYTSGNSGYGTSKSTQLSSEGSGIISRSDGYIITNAHVISGASSVQVVLYDGTICDAKVIGSDSITDLALLKIDASNLSLTAASFSSAKSASVAQTVLAIGNPGGLNFSSSVTQGIISALDRAVQDSSTGYVMYCIQTDTAINPGNSGGPLIDLYGNVIGITSSKIVASEYENMGFAIPYDSVVPIVNDLLAYGHVKDRATINISLALPSSVFRMSGWNSIPSGLCITQISGENEEKAGLKQYDIISAIDSKQISTMAQYSSYLLTKKPGDKVTLTVYRAEISGWSVQYSNKPIEVEITLSEAT